MNNPENTGDFNFKILRKIRGSWGQVNPVTKVIPNKKKNAKAKEMKKEIKNYE